MILRSMTHRSSTLIVSFNNTLETFTFRSTSYIIFLIYPRLFVSLDKRFRYETIDRCLLDFMLRIRDTGAMSQCRNFHLYRNEQGKQGVIDGRRNVFVPARYDTLIMRDTIWANWFGEFEKHAGLYVHIDGLTPMNRFGYLAR